MAIKCVFCGVVYFKGSPIHFHSFPDNEEEKNKWLEILQLSPEDMLGANKRYLCSRHFSPDCYSNNRLKLGSLPALNLQCFLYGEDFIKNETQEYTNTSICKQESETGENSFHSSERLSTSNSDALQELGAHIQRCITCWTTDSNSYFRITKRFYSGTTIKDTIILLVPHMATFLQDKYKVCRNCTKTLDAALKFITQCNFVQTQLKVGHFKYPNEDFSINNNKTYSEKDEENENIQDKQQPENWRKGSVQMVIDEQQDYKNIDIQENEIQCQDSCSTQANSEYSEDYKDINVLQNAGHLKVLADIGQLPREVEYQEKYNYPYIREDIETYTESENVQIYRYPEQTREKSKDQSLEMSNLQDSYNVKNRVNNKTNQNLISYYRQGIALHKKNNFIPDTSNLSTDIQRCITCWTTDSNSYFRVTKRFYSGTTIKDTIILLIPEMATFLQEKHKVCRNCTKTLDAALKFITRCNFVQEQLKTGGFKEPEEDLSIYDIRTYSEKYGEKSVQNEEQQRGNSEKEYTQKDVDDQQDCKNIDIQDCVIQCRDNYGTQVNSKYIEADTGQLPRNVEYQEHYNHPYIKQEIEEYTESENIQTNEKPLEDYRQHLIKKEYPELSQEKSNDQSVEMSNLQNSYNVENQVNESNSSGNINQIVSISKPSIEISINAGTTSKNVNHKLSSERTTLLFCIHCRKLFKNFQELRNHQLNECVNLIKSNTMKKAEHKDRPKKVQYRCRKCYRGFYKQSEFRKHTLIHPLPVKCKECNIKFENEDIFTAHCNTLHPDKKQAENFLCDICGKHFTIRHKYMSHKHVHRTDITYLCDICGISFNNKDRWITHKWTHCVKSIECDRCNKKFVNRFKLMQHIKRVHLPDETNIRVQCEECGKIMKNKTTLFSHLRLMHSNSGSLQCPNCPKVFSTSFYLSRHIRKTCRRKSGERRGNPGRPQEILPCKICGKYYKGASYLKLHQKNHFQKRRWACSKCGLTYKNSQTLKRHAKTHIDGENVQRCNVCWKKFETVTGLKKHMEIHNRPRHKCAECGEHFHRKFLLDDHILVEHSAPQYEYSPSIDNTPRMINDNEKVIVLSD